LHPTASILIKDDKQAEELILHIDQLLCLFVIVLTLLICFVKGMQLLFRFFSSLYHAHFDQDMTQ